MGLKFRRGSTAQQSGSLAFGEPYVNTTLGTLVVGGATGDIVLSAGGTGSTGNFGAISGSGLDITGNANIAGNLTLGGAITIGDASADTVNVIASLSSSLIPQTDNVFDLGSATKSWRDLYISTGSIKVVSNGAVVSTLSTNADGSQNFPNGLTVSGSLKVSGSIVVSGSTSFNKKVRIAGNIGEGINSNFENALEIGSNPDAGTGGAIFLGNTLSSSTWGIVSNGSNNLAIANQSGFQSRAVTLYNTENKIEFLYSGSLNANGAGFHNIRFDENGIIPHTSNRYDLGSATNIWRDLYISTGSIKVVSNGTVVSTLSTNADGSQNFPNGLTVSGSLKTSGSIKVGNYGNIKDTFGHIHMYTSGADYNNGGNVQFGGISGSAATGVDNFISFNGSPYTAASNTAVTVWGANDGGGAAIFLNRKSSQGVESWGYTPWTIGVDLGATSTPNGLYIGTGNTFLNRSIEFNYKGLNPNILFSGSGIIPAENNTYDLGTPTKAWRDLYISTGSIKIVSNGAVVSTLSTNADGSQNFPNGLSVTGSLKVSGSNITMGNIPFEIGGRGNIPDMNVVLGIGIMPNLTSGDSNVGIGRLVLNNLTTGFNNIAIGEGAGYGMSGSAQNNIAIGYGTGYFTTGSNVYNNIFIGTDSGWQCNNGFSNVGIGVNTLKGAAGVNDNFTKNTALGHQAGINASGASSNNIYLGANSGPTSPTEETQKFYVGRGEVGQTPFMLGTMTSLFPSLEINAQVVTISGSVLPNTTDVFQLGSTSKMWKTVIATSISGAIAATNGVVSGSSQITYASISSIPAGIVSGSSQVTLSSTTGGGTSDNVRFGSLGIGMAASGTSGRIDAANDVVAFSTSDIRLKENIKPIENALDKISKISGNTYDWKSELKDVHGYDGNDVGVIAQEIEAVLPQLVQDRDNGYKAVKYDKLVALLIEGIKEQQTQIHSLTIEIEKLKESKGL